MLLSMSEKSNLLIEETIDGLRNKPIKSTMLERLHLLEQADELVKDLPQPLQLGKGLSYILENASVPVSKHDILLGRVLEKVPDEDEEGYYVHFTQKFNGKPAWMIDSGHITFSWEMFLEYGIDGLVRKAEDKLKSCIENNVNQKKIDFLSGMVLVYKAFKTYIVRYGIEAQKEGMCELAEICEYISQKPPKTFYQAMQLFLLIGHAYSIYTAINSTITYGRLDDLLLEYYKKDVSDGILTKEMAGYIIDDFNCKNNLILGRGEHQMSGNQETDTGWIRNPTYDTPQYVVIGGYSNFNDHVNNPLTEIFIDRIVPRFENPVYMFRCTKDVKDSIWHNLCKKLISNGSIMVYNDETEIPAMINAGIERVYAVNYTMHGCNWPDIPGIFAVVSGINGRFTSYIIKVLVNDEAKLSHEYSTIDEIYSAVALEYKNELQKVCDRYREWRENILTYLPDQLSGVDCFMLGTIDNANNIACGSVKYNVMYNHIRNIATAADIMSSIDKLVFIDKRVSLAELVNACINDFDGYEELLSLCKKSPKFGCDNDFADSHAVRLMSTFLNIVDDVSIKDGVRDIHIFNVTTTDMGHIPEGYSTIATPDGRRNHAPLSENLSPTPGAAIYGITALMNSLVKLPFYRMHAGAFNLRLRNDWVSGEEGLERLKIVLSTFFDLGGMQVQISVADTKELLDAQLDPDKYRDLMVRITGYSAVFVDMCKMAQDEIIRRDELG